MQSDTSSFESYTNKNILAKKKERRKEVCFVIYFNLIA